MYSQRPETATAGFCPPIATVMHHTQPASYLNHNKYNDDKTPMENSSGYIYYYWFFGVFGVDVGN